MCPRLKDGAHRKENETNFILSKWQTSQDIFEIIRKLDPLCWEVVVRWFGLGPCPKTYPNVIVQQLTALGYDITLKQTHASKWIVLYILDYDTELDIADKESVRRTAQNLKHQIEAELSIWYKQRNKGGTIVRNEAYYQAMSEALRSKVQARPEVYTTFKEIVATSQDEEILLEMAERLLDDLSCPDEIILHCFNTMIREEAELKWEVIMQLMGCSLPDGDDFSDQARKIVGQMHEHWIEVCRAKQESQEELIFVEPVQVEAETKIAPKDIIQIQKPKIALDQLLIDFYRQWYYEAAQQSLPDNQGIVTWRGNASQLLLGYLQGKAPGKFNRKRDLAWLSQRLNDLRIKGLYVSTMVAKKTVFLLENPEGFQFMAKSSRAISKKLEQKLVIRLSSFFQGLWLFLWEKLKQNNAPQEGNYLILRGNYQPLVVEFIEANYRKLDKEPATTGDSKKLVNYEERHLWDRWATLTKEDKGIVLYQGQEDGDFIYKVADPNNFVVKLAAETQLTKRWLSASVKAPIIQEVGSKAERMAVSEPEAVTVPPKKAVKLSEYHKGLFYYTYQWLVKDKAEQSDDKTALILRKKPGIYLDIIQEFLWHNYPDNNSSSESWLRQRWTTLQKAGVVIGTGNRVSRTYKVFSPEVFKIECVADRASLTKILGSRASDRWIMPQDIGAKQEAPIVELVESEAKAVSWRERLIRIEPELHALSKDLEVTRIEIEKLEIALSNKKKDEAELLRAISFMDQLVQTAKGEIREEETTGS